MAPKPLVITSKKYPMGALSQAIDVIRRRMLVTALHDHSVAVAEFTVTRRAVDIEPLLPASHDSAVTGNGR